MLKHLLIAIAATISLSGCASNQPAQQAPALQTKSGKPEVEINASIDKVKSAIIDNLMTANYTVEQETDHMISAKQTGVAGCEDVKAILNGVHAETKVEQYITFTMLSESGKTRVIAVGYTRLSNGIRSELRRRRLGNAEAISTIQSRLGQVKQKGRKLIEQALRISPGRTAPPMTYGSSKVFCVPCPEPRFRLKRWREKSPTLPKV